MPHRTTSRDLIREFLAYLQVEKGLSANTLQSYARDIAKLQSWATQNRKQIDQLERQDLREWIAKHRTRFLERHTMLAEIASRLIMVPLES